MIYNINMPTYALKNGVITQKQYDKLPAKLLDGIIKKKGGASKKGNKKKK